MDNLVKLRRFCETPRSSKASFLQKMIGNRREEIPESVDGLSEREFYAAMLSRASTDYERWETTVDEDISEELEDIGRGALWWFMQKEEEIVYVWDSIVEDVVVDWVPYRWVCLVLDIDPDVYFSRLRNLVKRTGKVKRSKRHKRDEEE